MGVDVGGTTTRVAVLDDEGAITEHAKFPTSKNYGDFLLELAKHVDGFTTKSYRAAGIGIPAVTIDRKHGIGINFGNLPWQDEPVQADMEKLFKCPVVLENDAKLGALSEYMLLNDRYRRVLYIAPGTGIGIALVVNSVIDTSLGDGGGRTLLLEHKGRLTPWEDFASGRAIVERYGKEASDIGDEAIWQRIAFDLALGIQELIALTQPDVIVIGGSIGLHFDRYEEFLVKELKKYETPLLPIPPIMRAQRPEEAVLYGGYDLAKQWYPPDGNL